MKLKLLVLIGIFTIFLACNRGEDSNTLPNINGEYIGIFERDGNTSNVELNFNNGSFIGDSDTEKFPAICNGNYSVSNNTINFINECIWTAEFDWSLILSEEWNFEFYNNNLILSKSNGDKYILTKQ